MSKKILKNVTRFTMLPVVLLLLFAVSVWAVQPGMVNTVRGPIPAGKMGITLPHEHFVFAYPGWFADDTMVPLDRKARLKNNLEVVKSAQKYGIKTIIDATTNDVGGRDPLYLKELSKKTGLNIIMSTGLYTEHGGSPGYFKTRQDWYKEDIAQYMADLFTKEITEGVGKTGVKAGVIKCGTSGGKGPISAYETAVLKAAARAQKATGVPIITHTEGPEGGLEQAELLLAEGANPKKIMIGHVSNNVKDIEYHKAILAKGVYIAFDRFGLEIYTPTDAIAKIVAELCKQGYANQILLSHDTCNFWLGRWYKEPPEVTKALENWHVWHISKNVLPMLKDQGVTDMQIRMMMLENPRNLFLGL